ncbi:MAG: NAD-dependent epimerase/dehydratase [Candidatus Pacebacteria bacterium GW2011_GWB1_47_8]|nr:MAG: NAD-dependent epimerase/dehydratase [Candidatus Pacebacteria bacterium GW2011_GWA1_46_10]KKU84390.1 MAG: NAD-dependent epimerase/dehydratase [Candidatus Pacebacteria bacterium GW2011_GWB1_47_8]HCR81183.1 GDP-fucose synthetase [Candidatus Paceibacterota bacterium]
MKQNFWREKRVLVTGGAGFLGMHLVHELKKLSPKKVRVPRFETHDLRQQAVCAKVVKGIDIVIHLAANVGGIGYNQEFPGTLFYDNLVMGVHLMEEARQAGVKKFVSIGTICSYPKYTPVPFKEEDLWTGYPEETNAPYGLAKKMLLTQGQAYHDQYGFNAIYLLQVNLYGPGDNFNPQSSHVVPALIRKFIEARDKKLPAVEIWGTGKPTREFLYVEDAVRGIILATERYNKPEPINLGASFEISIKDLAILIQKLTGYQGKIVFNTKKPDGQPRRKLDVSKAKKEFGFEAQTKFEQGLKKTIEWYEKQTH